MTTYKCPTKIAILLAAYNAEKFIEEQIESIIKQTSDEWTLYIRNDGSSDTTQFIIDKYISMYPLKIIQIDKDGENLGCSKNFYRLLENVDAEYYMFCDADDVWFPEKVQISYDEIKKLESENKNKAALSFCDTCVCDANLNVLEQSYWESANINPHKYLSYNYIAICNFIGGSCSIFNNKAKELILPPRYEFLIYDYWIALQLSKYGVVSVIDLPLKLYRQHGNNICGVLSKSEMGLSSKLKNLHLLLREYWNNACLLRKIGYGSIFKYAFYKIKITLNRH